MVHRGWGDKILGANIVQMDKWRREKRKSIYVKYQTANSLAPPSYSLLPNLCTSHCPLAHYTTGSIALSISVADDNTYELNVSGYDNKHASLNSSSLHAIFESGSA